jgi:GTP pyrophosphokinase
MLSARFNQAFDFALSLHCRQVRKGTQIPYIAHLMSVSALVLENGGDEDLAIAALLHDAVEDQGGIATLKAIRSRFGERVAFIVEGCSDAVTFLKPAWRQRKEQYLDHLVSANQDIQLVSLSDKLHNARSLLRDLQQYGSVVWRRFNGGKEGTLWYYRQLADHFNRKLPGVLSAELGWIVAELERLA